MPDTTSNPSPPRIRFNDPPTLGKSAPDTSTPPPPPTAPPTAAPPTTATAPPAESPTPEPMAGISAAGSSKIRTFGGKADHVEKWSRIPNTSSTGATHVRTFHSKLNNESLAYMDQQINEWLAKHPDVDVKFVNSTVGMYAGKIKEAAIICQVWV